MTRLMHCGCHFLGRYILQLQVQLPIDGIRKSSESLKSLLKQSVVNTQKTITQKYKKVIISCRTHQTSAWQHKHLSIWCASTHNKVIISCSSDDDFVICRNAPYGQVLVFPSRRLVRPVADDDFIVLTKSSSAADV